MSYSAAASWSQSYTGAEISYPAEGVIRIFKGTYPDLIMPKPRPGDSILDLGCGDGRHLPLFHSLGLKCLAVEISDAIVVRLREQMRGLSIPADIRTGHAAELPFDRQSFDYLLTWNSCYYMSLGNVDFPAHVREMARVLKPGGWIVCSIPKKDSFIFQDSTPYSAPGYRVIRNDFFGVRNGEIMRCMASRQDVEQSFAIGFDSFCHADLDMDWFGLSYRWHVFVARRD